MAVDVRCLIIAVLLILLTVFVFAVSAQRHRKRAAQLAAAPLRRDRPIVIKDFENYPGYNPFTGVDDQCGDNTFQTCATGDFSQARKQIDGDIDYNVKNATDDPTFVYSPNNTFDSKLCDRIIDDSVYDGRKLMWRGGEFVAAETRSVQCFLCKNNVQPLDSNAHVARQELLANGDCRGPVPCMNASNSPGMLNGQVYYKPSGVAGDSLRVSNELMQTKNLTVEYLLGGAYPPKPPSYWSLADSERIIDGMYLRNLYDSDSSAKKLEGYPLLDMEPNGGALIARKGAVSNYLKTNLSKSEASNAYTIWFKMQVFPDSFDFYDSDTVGIPLLSLVDGEVIAFSVFATKRDKDTIELYSLYDFDEKYSYSIDANARQRIALVVENQIAKVYAEDTQFASRAIGPAGTNEGLTVVLGPGLHTELGSETMNGIESNSAAVVRIDELAIWNSPLTRREIQTLAQVVDARTTLTDMPLDQNSLTVCGATPTLPAGKADSFQVSINRVQAEVIVDDLIDMEGVEETPTSLLRPVATTLFGEMLFAKIPPSDSILPVSFSFDADPPGSVIEYAICGRNSHSSLADVLLSGTVKDSDSEGVLETEPYSEPYSEYIMVVLRAIPGAMVSNFMVRQGNAIRSDSAGADSLKIDSLSYDDVHQWYLGAASLEVSSASAVRLSRFHFRQEHGIQEMRRGNVKRARGANAIRSVTDAISQAFAEITQNNPATVHTDVVTMDSGLKRFNITFDADLGYGKRAAMCSADQSYPRLAAKHYTLDNTAVDATRAGISQRGPGTGTAKLFNLHGPDFRSDNAAISMWFKLPPGTEDSTKVQSHRYLLSTAEGDFDGISVVLDRANRLSMEVWTGPADGTELERQTNLKEQDVFVYYASNYYSTRKWPLGTLDLAGQDDYLKIRSGYNGSGHHLHERYTGGVDLNRGISNANETGLAVFDTDDPYSSDMKLISWNAAMDDLRRDNPVLNPDGIPTDGTANIVNWGGNHALRLVQIPIATMLNHSVVVDLYLRGHGGKTSSVYHNGLAAHLYFEGFDGKSYDKMVEDKPLWNTDTVMALQMHNWVGGSQCYNQDEGDWLGTGTGGGTDCRQILFPTIQGDGDLQGQNGIHWSNTKYHVSYQLDAKMLEGDPNLKHHEDDAAKLRFIITFKAIADNKYSSVITFKDEAGNLDTVERQLPSSALDRISLTGAGRTHFYLMFRPVESGGSTATPPTQNSGHATAYGQTVEYRIKATLTNIYNPETVTLGVLEPGTAHHIGILSSDTSVVGYLDGKSDSTMQIQTEREFRNQCPSGSPVNCKVDFAKMGEEDSLTPFEGQIAQAKLATGWDAARIITEYDAGSSEFNEHDFNSEAMWTPLGMRISYNGEVCVNTSTAGNPYDSEGYLAEKMISDSVYPDNFLPAAGSIGAIALENDGFTMLCDTPGDAPCAFEEHGFSVLGQNAILNTGIKPEVSRHFSVGLWFQPTRQFLQKTGLLSTSTTSAEEDPDGLRVMIDAIDDDNFVLSIEWRHTGGSVQKIAFGGDSNSETQLAIGPWFHLTLAYQHLLRDSEPSCAVFVRLLKRVSSAEGEIVTVSTTGRLGDSTSFNDTFPLADDLERKAIPPGYKLESSGSTLVIGGASSAGDRPFHGKITYVQYFAGESVFGPAYLTLQFPSPRLALVHGVVHSPTPFSDHGVYVQMAGGGAMTTHTLADAVDMCTPINLLSIEMLIIRDLFTESTGKIFSNCTSGGGSCDQTAVSGPLCASGAEYGAKTWPLDKISLSDNYQRTNGSFTWLGPYNSLASLSLYDHFDSNDSKITTCNDLTSMCSSNRNDDCYKCPLGIVDSEYYATLDSLAQDETSDGGSAKSFLNLGLMYHPVQLHYAEKGTPLVGKLWNEFGDALQIPNVEPEPFSDEVYLSHSNTILVNSVCTDCWHGGDPGLKHDGTQRTDQLRKTTLQALKNYDGPRRLLVVLTRVFFEDELTDVVKSGHDRVKNHENSGVREAFAMTLGDTVDIVYGSGTITKTGYPNTSITDTLDINIVHGALSPYRSDAFIEWFETTYAGTVISQIEGHTRNAERFTDLQLLSSAEKYNNAFDTFTPPRPGIYQVTWNGWGKSYENSILITVSANTPTIPLVTDTVQHHGPSSAINSCTTKFVCDHLVANDSAVFLDSENLGVSVKIGNTIKQYPATISREELQTDLRKDFPDFALVDPDPGLGSIVTDPNEPICNGEPVAMQIKDYCAIEVFSNSAHLDVAVDGDGEGRAVLTHSVDHTMSVKLRPKSHLVQATLESGVPFSDTELLSIPFHEVVSGSPTNPKVHHSTFDAIDFHSDANVAFQHSSTTATDRNDRIWYTIDDRGIEGKCVSHHSGFVLRVSNDLEAFKNLRLDSDYDAPTLFAALGSPNVGDHVTAEMISSLHNYLGIETVEHEDHRTIGTGICSFGTDPGDIAVMPLAVRAAFNESEKLGATLECQAQCSQLTDCRGFSIGVETVGKDAADFEPSQCWLHFDAATRNYVPGSTHTIDQTDGLSGIAHEGAGSIVTTMIVDKYTEHTNHVSDNWTCVKKFPATEQKVKTTDRYMLTEHAANEINNTLNYLLDRNSIRLSRDAFFVDRVESTCLTMGMQFNHADTNYHRPHANLPVVPPHHNSIARFSLSGASYRYRFRLKHTFNPKASGENESDFFVVYINRTVTTPEGNKEPADTVYYFPYYTAGMQESLMHNFLMVAPDDEITIKLHVNSITNSEMLPFVVNSRPGETSVVLTDSEYQDGYKISSFGGDVDLIMHGRELTNLAIGNSESSPLTAISIVNSGTLDHKRHNPAHYSFSEDLLFNDLLESGGNRGVYEGDLTTICSYDETFTLENPSEISRYGSRYKITIQYVDADALQTVKDEFDSSSGYFSSRGDSLSFTREDYEEILSVSQQNLAYTQYLFYDQDTQITPFTPEAFDSPLLMSAFVQKFLLSGKLILSYKYEEEFRIWVKGDNYENALRFVAARGVFVEEHVIRVTKPGSVYKFEDITQTRTPFFAGDHGTFGARPLGSVVIGEETVVDPANDGTTYTRDRIIVTAGVAIKFVLDWDGGHPAQIVGPGGLDENGMCVDDRCSDENNIISTTDNTPPMIVNAIGSEGSTDGDSVIYFRTGTLVDSDYNAYPEELDSAAVNYNFLCYTHKFAGAGWMQHRITVVKSMQDTFAEVV